MLLLLNLHLISHLSSLVTTIKRLILILSNSITSRHELTTTDCLLMKIIIWTRNLLAQLCLILRMERLTVYLPNIYTIVIRPYVLFCQKMFQLMLICSYVPVGFRFSYIVPIPKSNQCGHKALTCDDFRDIAISPIITLICDDFRGIAINPITSEVFEHCIL